MIKLRGYKPRHKDCLYKNHGLNQIQAGEMVEFAGGVKGIVLNLENENVGIIVLVVIQLLKKLKLMSISHQNM